VEWQNGGRGSEREGDREREGRSAPPTRRQAQQTDRGERDGRERDIENKEGGGDRQEISKTILV